MHARWQVRRAQSAPEFSECDVGQFEKHHSRELFNGGVRIFHIVDGPKGVTDAPPHLEEIGYYIPAAPAKNPTPTSQMNHAIVDEKGLIYANDRFTGGLYILRYTGTVPLD